MIKAFNLCYDWLKKNVDGRNFVLYLLGIDRRTLVRQSY